MENITIKRDWTQNGFCQMHIDNIQKMFESWVLYQATDRAGGTVGLIETENMVFTLNEVKSLLKQVEKAEKNIKSNLKSIQL